MAEKNPQSQQHLATRENEPGLKYLGFVQVAAIHALMRFSILYAYAKEHSGPLEPGVERVEGTVKSVVRPVYDKFHNVPVEVLKYVDRKVGESLTELDRHVPSNIKKASTQAITVAQKAPETARTVVSEVRRAGVVDTASGLAKSVYSKYEPTAKELYAKYEPRAELCAVSAWQKLNKLPLFPQVANVVLPPAAFCTEKYKLLTLFFHRQPSVRRNITRPLFIPLRKVIEFRPTCHWYLQRRSQGFSLKTKRDISAACHLCKIEGIVYALVARVFRGFFLLCTVEVVVSGSSCLFVSRFRCKERLGD